ncbi:hypothetical protein DL764_001503 [Monosporascus ibericus]|uniref:Peptidase A1 domain-containing protein n=1 Tax=Monosporascus ibericus TaxID=155417 RepID=A0A4Q4TQZ4_9PEZI|nr:hypothetical protein DL764_001503 [Monosporascus ibericus]
MVSSRFLSLFILSVASAAPFLTEGDLNSTAWTPDHVLQPHEVIVYGEGRMEVMHVDTYNALMASQDRLTDVPEVDESFLEFAHNDPPNVNITESDLQARQFSCTATRAMATDKTYDFVGWDIQMSRVAQAGITPIDITIRNGYTTSNTVQVSGNTDVNWIKDTLKTTFGVNYSRQWTTSIDISIKATVSPHYTGVMITKPLKTRRLGRVLQGCPGSFKQVGTFQADSHKVGSYGKIDWVAGAIAICQKKQYPLTFCNGNGQFI